MDRHPAAYLKKSERVRPEPSQVQVSAQVPSSPVKMSAPKTITCSICLQKGHVSRGCGAYMMLPHELAALPLNNRRQFCEQHLTKPNATGGYMLRDGQTKKLVEVCGCCYSPKCYCEDYAANREWDEKTAAAANMDVDVFLTRVELKRWKIEQGRRRVLTEKMVAEGATDADRTAYKEWMAKWIADYTA